MSQNGDNKVVDLEGDVMLYKNPEPLSLEMHQNLGLKNIEKPFSFVEKSHVVPLTIQEFGLASTCMPIIFAPDKKTPLAVLGTRSGDNVFVDKNGFWNPDVYIPAFVRRYPFIFAADEATGDYLVCIDRDAEMVGENPDIPFFDGETPSQYSQSAMQFLQEFEAQRKSTEGWVEVVSKYDLIENRTVNYTPTNQNGEEQKPVKIADYMAISEDKLNALSDEQFLELKKAGVLPGIYAHLLSLLQWQKMIQITIRINSH